MPRRAAVAGKFYDADQNMLVRTLEGCFLDRLGPGKLPMPKRQRTGNVLGLVVPHAGYVYSGAAAAHSYDALSSDGLPDLAVILGPNHHGAGHPVAVSEATRWITPLGSVHVEDEISEKIVQLSQFAQADEDAHVREHSIEVQLPFLQFISGHKISIVPISISHLGEADALVAVDDLSKAIATAVEGKNAIIIASTDFSHYESQEVANAYDSMALSQILAMNGRGLIRTVREECISMCGALGVAVMIDASKLLGATAARKLTYHTSGDVTGDKRRVVGYAAVAVEKL